MRKPDDRTGVDRRLRELICAFGLRNKSDLARVLGVGTSVLNNWCYRDNIPGNILSIMKEKFEGLNPHYMETGEGSLRNVCKTAEQDTADSVAEISCSVGRYPIDLITAEQINLQKATMMAEDFVVTCGDVDLGQVSEQLVPIHLPGGCAKYMFGCKGVSMEPRLHEGDFIGVNETMSKYERFDPERMYLIFTKTGKAMVKYVEDPGEEYDYLQLRTLNEEYKLDDDGRLPKEEFRAACKIVVVVSWL